VGPSIGWSLPAFLGIVVAFQCIHDLFFALFVIAPIPKGHNGMIDVFRPTGISNRHFVKKLTHHGC